MPQDRRAEHQPGPARRPQSPQVVVAAVERWRHPALALDALLEGDADQPARLVVGPGVVDAGEGAGVAEPLQAQLRAAVGAAVLEGVYAAVPRPHDDDRHVAHRRRLVVARLRNLAFEGKIVPGRAHEDAFALAHIDRRVVVECKGNMGEAGVRPDRSRRRRCGPRHGVAARPERLPVQVSRPDLTAKWSILTGDFRAVRFRRRSLAGVRPEARRPAPESRPARPPAARRLFRRDATGAIAPMAMG